MEHEVEALGRVERVDVTETNRGEDSAHEVEAQDVAAARVIPRQAPVRQPRVEDAAVRLKLELPEDAAAPVHRHAERTHELEHARV